MADKETIVIYDANGDPAEGRLINQSLFERDIYKDPETGAEGAPMYKAEVAFDPSEMTGENTFEDAVFDAVKEAFGEEAAEDVLEYTKTSTERYPQGIKWFHEGDVLAAGREENGKPGDAYKGTVVIRASTKFNSDGDDAPGGVSVYDEKNKKVTAANKHIVYNGAFGYLAIQINVYRDQKTRQPAVGYYLQAFQFTKDGERLRSAADHSKLFKPTGKAVSGRKTRKG